MKSASLWGTAGRVLLFRASRDELRGLDHRHLALGLVATWLVGVGRYWDHPDAHLLQYLGLGSVVYIFGLALLLALVAWPLSADGFNYRRALTFVALTSPPALLYALPVERWFELSVARDLNVWFLAAVAVWRVALWVFYLKRSEGLSYFGAAIATLLPLTVVVSTLAAMNLEHAVFNVMAGLREERTPNDGALALLVLLSVLSFMAILPLLSTYGVLVFRKVRSIRSKPGVTA